MITVGIQKKENKIQKIHNFKKITTLICGFVCKRLWWYNSDQSCREASRSYHRYLDLWCLCLFDQYHRFNHLGHHSGASRVPEENVCSIIIHEKAGNKERLAIINQKIFHLLAWGKHPIQRGKYNILLGAERTAQSWCTAGDISKGTELIKAV